MAKKKKRAKRTLTLRKLDAIADFPSARDILVTRDKPAVFVPGEVKTKKFAMKLGTIGEIEIPTRQIANIRFKNPANPNWDILQPHVGIAFEGTVTTKKIEMKVYGKKITIPVKDVLAITFGV